MVGGNSPSCLISNEFLKSHLLLALGKKGAGQLLLPVTLSLVGHRCLPGDQAILIPVLQDLRNEVPQVALWISAFGWENMKNEVPA